MQIDMFVIRHQDSGSAHFFAQHVKPGVSVLNAGDGQHAHPTQAMLDMYTIRHYKQDFTRLRVAIVGDILHSRVARSQIHALNMLNTAEVRVIAPRTLIAGGCRVARGTVTKTSNKGLEDVDVVIMLRLQKERMRGALLPSEKEYFRKFGLSQERLRRAKPDAIVMHPGPANRGVEIESSVMDGNQSVILQQVTFGIAVRMAVMSMIVGPVRACRPKNEPGRSRTVWSIHPRATSESRPTCLSAEGVIVGIGEKPADIRSTRSSMPIINTSCPG